MAAMGPHDHIPSGQLISQPEISKLGPSLLIVVVLGVLNPTIKIVDRRVRSKRVLTDLRPTRVMEPRHPEVLIIISRWSVASSMFMTRRLDASFSGSTRHDEEEGNGDGDESKKVSEKGDFERRH